MTRLIVIMVSWGLATPTFAQTVGGYIDANVTIFVVSGSTLLKSSASVSYLHEANMVACTGDDCRYELSGNHRIIQRGYTVAGITFKPAGGNIEARSLVAASRTSATSLKPTKCGIDT